MKQILRCLTLALFTSTAFAEAPPDPKFKLVLQIPPATAVDSVAVSPDGALVATATGEGGVRLYDAQNGKLIRVNGDIGDRCVVFSPDGKTITAAGFHMDKRVALWDVATGRRLRTFEGQLEWEADATAISPDGRLLASSATDKQVLVWEIASGKLLLRLKDQPTRVSCLAFSPDSQTLAGAGGDKTVRLWDCATGQVKRSLEGHADWICALAFSADGKSIASGSCDWGFHRGHDWPRPPLRGVEQCEWILWDASSGKARRTVRAPGRLLSLDFAPDGRSLACGIAKEVRLYDLSSNACRTITTHDGDITSVTFTHDGSAILSASHDQTVRRTRVSDGKETWRLPGWFEVVNSVALSRDRSLLVTGSSDWRLARGTLASSAKQIAPGAVRVWETRTASLRARLGDPEMQVLAVDISADGRWIAAGGMDRTQGLTCLFDAQSAEKRWSMPNRDAQMLSVAFSPDGSLLASGDSNGVITLRQTTTGQTTTTFTGLLKGGAAALLFSPDGTVLYGTQANGGALAWDLKTSRLIHTLYTADSHMLGFTIDRRTNSIGLNSDGSVLATCASSTNGEFVDGVRIWNTHSGALTHDFSAQDIHGQPMALSPDGKIIATGGKSIKLWDARTGRCIRELFGMLKRTQSIAFSADGKLIVSGGSYGTTNLWEVETGRHLATFTALPDRQTGGVSDQWLACTPDGYYTGSRNVNQFIAWRSGDELLTPVTMDSELHNPKRVEAALKLP